jgi:hypothetical protein
MKRVDRPRRRGLSAVDHLLRGLTEVSLMANTPKLLDVVALTVDLPERGLVRGQVGTIVEALDGNAYEIEFSDDEGRTYATLALRPAQFMILHHRPVKVA